MQYGVVDKTVHIRIMYQNPKIAKQYLGTGMHEV